MKTLIVKPYIPADATPEIAQDIQGDDFTINFRNESEKRQRLAEVKDAFRRSFFTRKGKDRFPSTVSEDKITVQEGRVRRIVKKVPRQIFRMETFTLKSGKRIVRFRNTRTGRFAKVKR